VNNSPAESISFSTGPTTEKRLFFTLAAEADTTSADVLRSGFLMNPLIFTGLEKA